MLLNTTEPYYRISSHCNASIMSNIGDDRLQILKTINYDLQLSRCQACTVYFDHSSSCWEGVVNTYRRYFASAVCGRRNINITNKVFPWWGIRTTVRWFLQPKRKPFLIAAYKQWTYVLANFQAFKSSSKDRAKFRCQLLLSILLLAM